MTGLWFDNRASAGELRLFCFAHAGGGAAFFYPWRAALAPDIAVTPVVLPGREARWREPPYRRMEALLAPLCDAVAAAIDRPFAFFGHSVGAVIAYEVAARLSTMVRGSPLCLVVSARRAPHLPSRRPPIHELPTERFLAELQALNGTADALLRDPALVQALLPGLRADFELNESYAPSVTKSLALPISALVGDRDPLVDVAEMRRWREVTTGTFGLRVFNGDHFFLAGGHVGVLDAIRSDVLRQLRVAMVRQDRCAWT
ncbi:MAG: thioesterase [Deltaproteobacteria bacterium]|nr:MAG: thioesterase [Deltaproteobacteria bacterium]